MGTGLGSEDLGSTPALEALSKSLTPLGLNFLDSKMTPVCQALLEAPYGCLSLGSYNHLLKSWHVIEEELGTREIKGPGWPSSE